MWTVTRQIQFPDGSHVVEISRGGIDYCNPDALESRYAGEFCEHEDPRDAVESAIAIAQQWQADEPDEDILIDYGATGGMTLPFDGMELCEETFAELRRWAENSWAALEKCAQCGELLRGEQIEQIACLEL